MTLLQVWNDVPLLNHTFRLQGILRNICIFECYLVNLIVDPVLKWLFWFIYLNYVLWNWGQMYSYVFIHECGYPTIYLLIDCFYDLIFFTLPWTHLISISWFGHQFDTLELHYIYLHLNIFLLQLLIQKLLAIFRFHQLMS